MTASSLSLDELSRIFEAMPTPYLLLRADSPRFTIVGVNDAYNAATGTKRAEMVGRGLFEVFPDNPDDSSASGVSDLRTSLERVLLDGKTDEMGVQKYDVPVRDGSGRFETKYWTPINTPVVNAHGKVEFIAHRAEDVTEFILAREREGAERADFVAQSNRLEAEVRRGSAEVKSANRGLKVALEQLAEANEKLKEVDRIKTEFFSNVSHEFRTPLTLMLGPLEELLRQPEDKLHGTSRELAETAQRGASRLLKLVNSLLDFSRLEAGRANPRFEPTDLGLLTTEAASHFHSLFTEAGLSLAIDCAEMRPVSVDRDMWEKVVLNLLSNAFKFTFEGEVSVVLREVEGQAQLTVSDSGAGIPEEELTRIFDRFHRIQGQRSRAFEGSGIGLALVREIVGLHGGTIEARNGPKGAIFTISIPIVERVTDEGRAPARSHDGLAESYVREAERWLAADASKAGGTRPAAAQAAAARRVLLVDDNADMRAYVTRLLEDAGYVVQAAASADDALAYLETSALPDLILSDVMMPGALDGFGLLRAVRSNPRTETAPFVLLSARAGEEARIEGLSAGADEYIVKPFGVRELIARIDAAIRLARLRHEAVTKERELEVVRAESKFRQALDAARMGEVILDMRASRLIHTPAFARLFGYPPDSQLTRAEIQQRVHPDDRANTIERWSHVVASGATTFETEFRIVWPDGTTKWVTGRGRIERDASGAAYEAGIIYMDITERKWVEERQSLLFAELNHRVKNTLSTIQSIALQTRMDSATLDAFGERFEARMTALASAHDLLTRASWEGASLADAVGRMLAPYMRTAGDPSRIAIDGPVVKLNPDAAVTLHMAFHELATNAAKYGALSTSAGRLDVRWSIDRTSAPDVVELTWTEHGGPAVKTPTRRGFGMRLIETGLARELNSAVAMKFEPQGLICVMRLPASRKVTPL